MIRLVLFQPEIPHNTGTLVRSAACIGFQLDIIGPCGFLLSDKHFKRAGMDYFNVKDLNYHSSYEEFEQSLKEPYRLIAMISKLGTTYSQFAYKPGDILIAGPESTGLPSAIINKCDYCITIPMKNSTRSLNLAIASAIIISEAVRQLC